MLRHASKIDGYSIGASDGPIGAVSDLLFDDVTWRVRWLVVDTGGFLGGRNVLLPPSALGAVNHIGRQLAVRLTKQQVKDSPEVAVDEPVSRRMETDLYDYYGWSPYWSTGFYMGGYGYDGGLGFSSRASEADVARRAPGDTHLRSVGEVTGYHIHARDGEIGHVADALIEDGDWSVHYLVVDTRNWWPGGRKVLLGLHWVDRFDWYAHKIHVRMTRADVKSSPVFEDVGSIHRDYETRLHEHAKRPGYWL